ncbi:glycosyltransferase family 2 protein [Alkalihalobacillus sp. BA299]|uniref:glycosyltransferase family 2 protein n=1 Tax=Alkalihalobacillus sp. BA299 TaxID=2815938 RepID=UPI001ADC7467|nr:glycosyltransferase family 2 protein [Alkalihalobacillus sp. BA299]
MCLISVIIPTWNREKTLKKAILSALNQTVDSIEVLVCDDGSTDKSENIVISLKDDRVKWIPGERGGRPAIPRNRGIKISKGQWIAFLDSDDEWMPNKLEKQLTTLTKHNHLASCTNAYRYIPNKGVSDTLLINENKSILTLDDLIKVNQVICSSTIVHKSLFLDVIGFPEGRDMRGVEDYALWLRVATKTKFAFINEPLLVYNDDPVNSERSQSTNDPNIQRKKVFSNLLIWSKNTSLEKKIIQKIYGIN